MKLYKDGNEINADKAQLHLMLAAGWTLTNEPEKDLSMISASEEIINEEVVEEKITPPKKKAVPKKKAAPKKKPAPKITPIKNTDKE